MEFLFNKDLIGFEWMRYNRRWRVAMFWWPLASFKIDPKFKPVKLRDRLDWLWSLFVFFDHLEGYIGGCEVDQRTWRVLGFAVGYRQYQLTKKTQGRFKNDKKNRLAENF